MRPCNVSLICSLLEISERKILRWRPLESNKSTVQNVGDSSPRRAPRAYVRAVDETIARLRSVEEDLRSLLTLGRCSSAPSGYGVFEGLTI